MFFKCAIMHTYIQTIFLFSGKFQKYDYLKVENLKKYNQTSPPEYNLKSISTPVALFYAPNDQVVSPQVR